MDHRHFEERIFTEGELSTADRRALNEHLAVCDRCLRLERSWRAARGRLTSTAVAAPAPGFSARWSQRLEQDNRRRRDRRSLTLLSAAFTAAALYFSVFGVRLLETIVDFAGTKIPPFDEFAAFTSTIRMTLPSALDFSGAAPVLMVPLAVMAFFAAIGAGAIAWLKMFRLLARVQGFTQWA